MDNTLKVLKDFNIVEEGLENIKQLPQVINKDENGAYRLDDGLEEYLVALDYKEKIVKEQKEEIRQMLIDKMEEYGLTKIETDMVRISYIAENERETFDKKAFQTDNPDLYDEYVRFTTVKPSVQIKCK